jgi:hypothetical protein
MNLKEKKSKVAICERCQKYTLASHTDYITNKTEKEFTELANIGFTVKIETLEETQQRGYSYWEDCINAKCETKNK